MPEHQPVSSPTSSSATRAAAAASLGGRSIGRVNWLGLKTLYGRECRRFVKVWSQTLGAPAVTTLLFMMIFTLALGADRRVVGDIAFADFLAPGLIIMAIIQNSFANTSSSLIIAKVQGNIVDTLMPPLNAVELTLGFTGGAVTRGIIVGIAVMITFALWPGVTIQIENIWAVLYFGISASLMLGLLGALAGVWAEKFDNMAAVTNFVITPLSLLSGTFYSIERLDPSWQIISRFNPFFYLIDGFRYGFLGRSDSDLVTGGLFVLALNLFLFFSVVTMFRRGYKLKA